MHLFDTDREFPHERVTFCRDRASGLRAIIAIHDTTIGPAAGGCRMWPYSDEEVAIADALRLSEAMTWKNALAGLPLGGGKSVIIGDSHTERTPELLRAFGTCIDELGGRYWAAEDVGIGPPEVAIIHENTRYTFGNGMDPSPWTAFGGLMGITAAVRHRFATGLDGIRVAIQGVGHVGLNLARLLTERGAVVIVSDVDGEALDRAVSTTGATAVAPDEIHAADADVFAPCALGGSISDATIPRLKASIVCGLANNQLATPADGRRLHQRNILYVPDFVVNSGGMLSVAGPIFGQYDTEDEIRERVAGIEERVSTILQRAEATETPPAEVADEMAREVVRAARA